MNKKDKQLLEQSQELLDCTTLLVNNDTYISLEDYLELTHNSIVLGQCLASQIVDDICVRNGDPSIYE